MSRFFRSGDSTSSSSDNEEDAIETIAKAEPATASDGIDAVSSDASALEVSENNQVGAVNPSSQHWTAHHKDVLLHALLEDWSLNETVKSSNDVTRDATEVQAEARARYLRLVSQLGSLDVVSADIGSDEYAATRQKYRDGLQAISRQSADIAVSPGSRRLLTDGNADGQAIYSLSPGQSEQNKTPDQLALQGPLRRLLGYSGQNAYSDFWSPHIPSPTQFGLTQQGAVSGHGQSRYLNDFEELKVLGHGGYGIVYRARNRLDNQAYAVKKVPLSPARLHRVRTRGQLEVDEILLELRTLARLNHPNIVRYYSAWVEWADGTSPNNVGLESLASDATHTEDAVGGADDSDSRFSRRVYSEDDIDVDGIVFEHSKVAESLEHVDDPGSSLEHSDQDRQLRRRGTRSTIATVSEETVESIEREPEVSASIHSTANGAAFAQPTLAVHIQMSLHPMTLADLLNNKGTESAAIQHCYHLEPSVGISMAILEGLQYLHEEGVVHRDIKPANIFLSPTKTRGSRRNCVDLSRCGDCSEISNRTNDAELEICIGDFGLAAVVSPGTQIGDNGLPTSPGPVGTAIYRPPTSLVETSLSTNLDIYALGVVLFELLWRFDTRMERHQCIHDLKEGRYPEGFCEWVGKERGVSTMECIDCMLATEGGGIGIPELKEKLAALTASQQT